MKISNINNQYFQYNIPPKAQTAAESSSFSDAIIKSMDYISHQTNSAKLEQKHIELSARMYIPVDFLRWIDLSDSNIESWVNRNFGDLTIWLGSFFYNGISVDEVNRISVSSESDLPMDVQHGLIYQVMLHKWLNWEGSVSKDCPLLANNRTLIELMASGIITLEALLTAPMPNIRFIDFEMQYNPSPNHKISISDSGWRPLSEVLANPSLLGIPFFEDGFSEWWEYFWERLTENDTEISEQTRQLLKQLQATFSELHS